MAVYEGVIVWNWNGEEFNTVLHYDDGDAGPPDFQELTDYVRAQFETAAMPNLVNDLTYVGMRWREDIPGGVGNFYPNTDGDLAGSAGAAETAGQLALIIRKVGVGSVRPHYGRIYVPGVTTSGLASTGLWSSSVTTNMALMFGDILTIEDTAGTELDMVIKASDPSKPNTQAYTPVATLSALGNPGVQRRRRRGTGI